MQIAFFVSPVIWMQDQLGSGQCRVLPFNPFFSLLEIVRAPLLGALPGPTIWLSAALYSIVLCGLAWVSVRAGTRPHRVLDLRGRAT